MTWESATVIGHRLRRWRVAWVAMLAGALAGCGKPEAAPAPGETNSGANPPAARLSIHSQAFSDGAPIPVRFTGDGADLSPPLTWDKPPAASAELALIVDDPDAPSRQPFVHWVIYHIPPGVTELPEGLPHAERLDQPLGAMQGLNSFMTARLGYRGPASPRGNGTHHYHFHLYALDAGVKLGPGADKADLVRAMAGHVVGEGDLVGTYARP